MISKVFIDTNIFLDILLERKPFYELSQEIILQTARKDITTYISGSSVTDLYYICKKGGIEDGKILNYLKELMGTVEVLNIDKAAINDAISSGMKDFEDAVQIMACKKEGIDLIITRNKKDFTNDWIKVQTPNEFLSSLSTEIPPPV
jgi:predicted nucleic acid-binding protein